jgi:cytochrome c biogenesis protein CcmG/thiol:disulfide interchange protein DsbE
MHRFRIRLVAALVGAALCTAAVAHAGDEPAPARKILAAADFKVSDYAGKVLIVDFWASWCKPCGESLPWLSNLAATHGKDGLAVVAVNVEEDLAKGKKMLNALDPHIVVVHDPEGKLAKEYDLQGMPSAFVYDRAGKLHACHVGFLAAEADAKRQEILDLLKDKGDGDAH